MRRRWRKKRWRSRREKRKIPNFRVDRLVTGDETPDEKKGANGRGLYGIVKRAVNYRRVPKTL
jgi:hypothetical protein